MNVCAATKRDGSRCKVAVGPSQEYCYAHDPSRAEERTRNARLAAQAKHSRIGRELQGIRELLEELLWLIAQGRLNSRARTDVQALVQLAQCYLRATELQAQLVERPIDVDLNASSLRAAFLKRIEALEHQQREREEQLAELSRLAAEYGIPLDTKAL